MLPPAGAPEAIEPTPAREADPAETSGVRVPPPLFYIAGFLVGVAVEAVLPIDRPPLAITILMTAIGFAGWLALDGAAMLSFNRAGTSLVPIRPSAALVTTGPYRFTRNPMYLGMAFLYLAFALGLGFVWPLIVLPLVLVAVDRLLIAREEAYLVRRFGQSYRDYLKATRRWL
jgi:protein-S-isoprenylcysteine O-methyltransferase Ste14